MNHSLSVNYGFIKLQASATITAVSSYLNYVIVKEWQKTKKLI